MRKTVFAVLAVLIPFICLADTFNVDSLGMKFVYIKPGSFMMGSPSGESGRDNDEKQHRVTLTKGFYMQTTEVTQGQWKAVMGSNPSHFKNSGDDRPVEQVSWNDVQEFIRKLNQKTGKNYRLPTEAEWEYACRAGSTTRFCFGDSDSSLGSYAWYSSNSGSKSHTVAQKQPNAWGLYDMHGNVWEWCQDWYGNYSTSSVTDPTGASSGSRRVYRGGGWSYYAWYCRSADRNSFSPDNRNGSLGFRLAGQ
jgi:formylglycine-generating enzyme required for sulfatase activity